MVTLNDFCKDFVWKFFIRGIDRDVGRRSIGFWAESEWIFCGNCKKGTKIKLTNPMRFHRTKTGRIFLGNIFQNYLESSRSWVECWCAEDESVPLRCSAIKSISLIDFNKHRLPLMDVLVLLRAHCNAVLHLTCWNEIIPNICNDGWILFLMTQSPSEVCLDSSLSKSIFR